MNDRRETPARQPRKLRLSDEGYVAGVLAGDRTVLSRTISLVESANPTQRESARRVLAALLPHTGKSERVGITGVPGVGKSTFIEALGVKLTAAGKRVAVLAVDPSSRVSGGSILGDKTRMANLANDPNAYIRPSPTSGTLGGVASHTRESMLVCEAAGFDVILVETVGVGQSETVVSEMVDFFLALMLPGAGDELQGIKRGLLELVDLIAVNKADGESLHPARLAAQQYETALRTVARPGGKAAPGVVTCSALTGAGIEQLWERVTSRLTDMRNSGELTHLRRLQAEHWFRSLVDEGLRQRFERDPSVARASAPLAQAVREGQLLPDAAAEQLLQVWDRKKADHDHD